MKTQVLNKEGLSTYDQEIKDYIKSQGMGVTLEEVKALIDSSDKNTTYTLTKNENNEIVLTGSDGSTTSVTDTDTNTCVVFKIILQAIVQQIHYLLHKEKYWMNIKWIEVQNKVWGILILLIYLHHHMM